MPIPTTPELTLPALTAAAAAPAPLPGPDRAPSARRTSVLAEKFV